MLQSKRYQRAFAVCSMADGLTAFLNKRGGEERLLYTRLWEHWAMVMGPELTGLGAPLGQRKDTLLIGVPDSMAAQEVAMQAGEILERANAFMNRICFTRVQVELMMGRTDLSGHAPTARPAPSPPAFPRPERLGALLGQIDPANPVGRCYEAYVRFFSKR